MDKIELNSCSEEELSDLSVSLGDKAFRGRQIYNWLYKNRAGAITDMVNIPEQLRLKLGGSCVINILKEAGRQVSKTDGTIKILFELVDGEKVEAVLLPDGERVTACVSSQVGCRIGCRFCSTAQIGFKRNLTAAEIIEQIRLLEEAASTAGYTDNGRLTNIVFMGMGEPLDNSLNLVKALKIITDENAYSYSHKRITISTAGISSGIKAIAAMTPSVNLAVSLNAPNQEIREKIMPISKKFHLSSLISEIKKTDPKKMPVTFEYVLLRGINDSKENARELVKLVNGMPVKINLIRYNGGGSGDFSPPSEKNILEFQRILTNNNIKAFIRKSLGSDIAGACGQLAAGYKNGKGGAYEGEEKGC